MTPMTLLQMAVTTGKSCAVKVGFVALGLLAGAVVTGGADLLIAGAYAPVLMAFCAN